VEEPPSLTEADGLKVLQAWQDAGVERGLAKDRIARLDRRRQGLRSVYPPSSGQVYKVEAFEAKGDTPCR
jgi:hypothetical protein